MITRLTHTDSATAEKIRAIFQVSYKVEAKLLKAIDFPPLRRTVQNFLKSNTHFYGFWKEKDLAAVIEIKKENTAIHIQSLVVNPIYFRQGIARQLLSYIFKIYHTDVFTVETGVDNHPAIALYKQFAFREVKWWDTDHGVRKVRFEVKK